jgi:hypothetical protein
MYSKVSSIFDHDTANKTNVPAIFTCSSAYLFVKNQNTQAKMSTPKGPFRLVTVNTAPERAKRLIGRMAEALKDRYTIIHVDNCESM